VVHGQRQTYSRGGRVGADRPVMFMARRLLETRESAKS
jgi:hypothetical protein